MGGVDAELVRAPRQRTEADERAALAALQHFVEGLRRLGVGRTHLLAGAVVGAGPQGQVDEAAVRRDGALEQGDVLLLHGARLEEGLQAAVHVGGLGPSAWGRRLRIRLSTEGASVSLPGTESRPAGLSTISSHGSS